MSEKFDGPLGKNVRMKPEIPAAIRYNDCLGDYEKSPDIDGT